MIASMNSRIGARDIGEHEGKEVTLAGWVGGKRDHGKIAFIDLRDRSGSAQCVVSAKDAPLWTIAETLRPEWVVKLVGEVVKRPESMINADSPTGKWEVKIRSIEVLNEAVTPPIAIDTDGKEIGEESRLKYRYLDLRRERLQNNLTLRHEIISFIRDYLNEREFLEIETPIISKANVETGARNYIVPSRIYPGQFYGLPQSPQQYKQLFMVAGLERYYQIAKCLRDEDTRGDRQPEFTQLDLEMSFVEREDVMGLIEAMYIDMVGKVTPEKKIWKAPFPILTYAEAMEKYGSDKPDLRTNKNDPNELAFCWVIDFPFFEKNDEGKWTFTHNPFSAPKKEHMEWLLRNENVEQIVTQQYDLVLNGVEIGGGSIRNHRPEALKAVFAVMGMDEEKIEASFGHMIKALSYGAPPHGGIAPGIDRLIMILANEPNIREVIAFPKTGDARDLMMDAPSTVDKKQLEELGLEIKKR